MEAQNADLSSLRIERGNELKNPEKNSRIYKIIGTITVLVLLGLMINFGWKSLTDPAVEVKLVTAVLQSPSQSGAVLTASGYVVAQRKAAVASKGTGRLIALNVVEGDVVHKDEIIARIEDNDIKAQYEQSKANLKLNEADVAEALRNYNRQKDLLKSGAATQMELDASESRYSRVLASVDVAKALVTGAEVALENTLIRAPFNGTVLTKNADVGEVVAPLGAGANSKAAVVTIADMTSLQAEIDVSESNLEKITPNQECEIRLDAYPDQAYQGFVSKIVPTADRAKATVMVKVGFKTYDKRVLPEMSAKVVFLNGNNNPVIENSKQFLVIPQTSVVKRNDKTVVFIIRDSKAVELQVITGRKVDSYVEITSGLSAGDKVIETVDDKTKDGMKVQIK